MPILSADIKVRLSVLTGSAGNTVAQANPNNALGKYISTTDVVDATLNNLFDDVTGDENAASEAEYRCIFIYNSHGTLTLQSAKLWISAEVAGGAAIAIGLDPAGVVAVGSVSAQATIIANEDAAPAGVSFSSPTTKSTGLNIGNLAAGQCIGVWVRRTTA